MGISLNQPSQEKDQGKKQQPIFIQTTPSRHRKQTEKKEERNTKEKKRPQVSDSHKP
jgi:hypothetical protein